MNSDFEIRRATVYQYQKRRNVDNSVAFSMDLSQFSRFAPPDDADCPVAMSRHDQIRMSTRFKFFRNIEGNHRVIFEPDV